MLIIAVDLLLYKKEQCKGYQYLAKCRITGEQPRGSGSTEYYFLPLFIMSDSSMGKVSPRFKFVFTLNYIGL